MIPNLIAGVVIVFIIAVAVCFWDCIAVFWVVLLAVILWTVLWLSFFSFPIFFLARFGAGGEWGGVNCFVGRIFLRSPGSIFLRFLGGWGWDYSSMVDYLVLA